MTIHMIYMAAGNGRRFRESLTRKKGSAEEKNKLLIPFRGLPLYQHGLSVLSTLSAVRNDCTLTVVTQYREIFSVLSEKEISCILNPDSRKGVSYTIRAGIEAVQNELKKDDFLLFMAADQPGIQKETLEKLLSSAVPGTETACVSFQGQKGNPCLFSAVLVPELLALKEDEGGKKVLKQHSCIEIPAGSWRELSDIDEEKDLNGYDLL